MNETPASPLLPFEDRAVFWNTYEPPPGVDCPPRRPRSARLVAEIHIFSETPANQRIDTYWLSLDRRRSHWLLWLEFPNEAEGGYESCVYAYLPRRGVDAQAAAQALLACGWRAELRNGWLRKLSCCVFKAGLFGRDRISEISDAVCPTE